MIENYIFDFGNVLCEFNPQKLCAYYIQDAQIQKDVSEVVFDRLYWDKLDDGSIADEEVKKCILDRLPKELGEIGCRIYDNWIYKLTPVDGMKQLIRDISLSGKGLYLISNISKGFAQTYTKVPWIKDVLSYFDGIVLSGTIGKIKPNKEIFEYLFHTYSIKANECIFIDDSPKNIKGAEDLGISGYLFDGDADKLRSYIETH